MPEIRHRVVALMPTGTMCAMAIMQEEILAPSVGTPACAKILLVKDLSDASVEAVALFCGYHELRPAPK